MSSSLTPSHERRATAYYERALEFLNAYFELSLAHSYQKLENKDLQLASAKLTLVCLALELTLKGWLASQDREELDSYDLVNLANGVAPHYPALQPFLDAGTIARLNASYLADSGPNGEYPEDKALMAQLTPFDSFANVVGKLRHDLGAALGLANSTTISPLDMPRRRRRDGT
jgi:hypothetical protein